MFIFKESAQVHAYVAHLKSQGKKIGFVPTMGALHAGHMSLIQSSKSNGDLTVCSIFVNPTQFDNADDLSLYPRTLQDDLDMLSMEDCDIAFIPSVNEVYPKGESAYRLENKLDKYTSVLEGEFRPGHFEGMMQVVKRLLDIVPADRIYMGQKDYQQKTIVFHMLKALNIKTDLVTVPIKREKDGLAMSSRNRRIEPNLRASATLLYETLLYANENLSKNSIESLVEYCSEKISQSAFRLEYFKLIDGDSLKDLKNVEETANIVALVAAWLGEVRLIDNMILKS